VPGSLVAAVGLLAYLASIGTMVALVPFLAGVILPRTVDRGPIMMRIPCSRTRHAGALAGALVAVLAALGAGICTAARAEAPGADDFEASLAAWKSGRAERLRRPDGWLTVVGLAWLRPGENAVGSGPEAVVRLPAERAPARLGTIRLEGPRATFTAAPGAAVTVAGRPVSEIALASDADPAGATRLEHGSLTLYLIARGDRLGVRIKDARAAALAAFRGLDYYPADRRWRIEGRFEPAPAGSRLEIPDSTGGTQTIDQPGWVRIELGGVTHRLIAFDDTGDGRLFLVFGDRTNGRETYGGGRFLYTDPPRDGKVLLDFNRAYNPPCVFTPWATCPLPPPGNKLPVAIEAGEKKLAGAAH
jgi:uncharacterized protein (DUF1684 family)